MHIEIIILHFFYRLKHQPFTGSNQFHRQRHLYFQTLHAAGQIDILRYWLTQLVPRENENKCESIATTTRKIIRKHQKIIKFSENIESIYMYIALLQFVSNTIMICSLAFLIVTVSEIVREQVFCHFFNNCKNDRSVK